MNDDMSTCLWPFGSGGFGPQNSAAVTLYSVILAVLLLTIPESASAEGEPDCSIATRLTKVRPDPDGPPTPVRVGIRLIDVGDINVVRLEHKVIVDRKIDTKTLFTDVDRNQIALGVFYMW